VEDFSVWVENLIAANRNLLDQMFPSEWFRQNFGAKLARLHRENWRIFIRRRGHINRLKRWIDRSNATHHFDAVELRHFDVGDHPVGRIAKIARITMHTVARRARIESNTAQGDGKSFDEPCVVIDDQDTLTIRHRQPVWIHEQITVHDGRAKWVVEISGFSILSLEKPKSHEGVILHAKNGVGFTAGQKTSAARSY
jgi:hypothetical protein